MTPNCIHACWLGLLVAFGTVLSNTVCFSMRTSFLVVHLDPSISCKYDYFTGLYITKVWMGANSTLEKTAREISS